MLRIIKALLGLGLGLVSATMKDCSSASTIGHITNLRMDPAAPVAGAYTVVTVDYTLDTPVLAGTVKYELSFNGFPLTPTVNDLCTDLAESTPCPLAAGPIQYTTTLQMGDDTIHGTLDGKATWTSQALEEIICWEFVVRI